MILTFINLQTHSGASTLCRKFLFALFPTFDLFTASTCQFQKLIVAVVVFSFRHFLITFPSGSNLN